jgi:hypothetical protein
MQSLKNNEGQDHWQILVIPDGENKMFQAIQGKIRLYLKE